MSTSPAGASGRSVAWNVAGGVIGALLAAISILGIVGSQTSAKQTQTNQEIISYNS
jgi:hypothetical protein